MSTSRESSDNYDMSNSYIESQRKSAVRSTYTMSMNRSVTQRHTSTFILNALTNKFHSMILAILSSKLVHIDVRCTYIFFSFLVKK